jgi:choline dehydrogenase-like flavoprotein
MSHSSFQVKGSEVVVEADVVVVGTGAGGAAAAVALARAGVKVLLVEAGPWRDPADYPVSTYGAMRDMMDDWGSTITMGRAFWPVVQAKLVGGTTVINSAICVRTPEDIFTAWQQEFGIATGDYPEKIWAFQDQIERELHVGETEPAFMGRSNELALRGDVAAAYHGHVIRRFAKACIGSGQCLQGCKSERKQSTNLNYVPETLARGGSMLSCAPVDKVLFQGGRAIGVTGRFKHPQTGATGAAFTARAKKAVIIAASATHSPALLRRSGLRHRPVGAWFRAHPGTGVFGLYPEVVDTNVGVTQGWSSSHFRTSEGFKIETLSIPMEMAISRFAGGGRAFMEKLKHYRHVAMWCHALRARSPGRVYAGLGGKPLVHYSLDRDDMLRFRQGMLRVAELHFAAGARAIIPGIAGLPFSLERHELDKLAAAPLDPRAYVAILSHLFGGCVMGADDSKAVCDAKGQVYGRKGLWVADASLMPDNIGVNPQHTIMAMAMQVATEVLRAEA